MVRNALVVEIDTAKNGNVMFPPLDKKLRGRFSFTRTKLPEAMRLLAEWPGDVIPGQQIRVDIDGRKAAVIEPLHDVAYQKLRQKIEKSGSSIAPAEEEYSDIHVATWLHWLKVAIDSGLARILSGSMPAEIGEPLPDTRFPNIPGNDLAKENRELRDRLAQMEGSLNELRAMIQGKR